MNKHYHVIMGSPGGVIYREQPFEDGGEAIKFFMSITRSFLSEKDNQVNVELSLFEMVNEGSDSFVYINAGSLLIAWSPCEDKCNSLGIWN